MTRDKALQDGALRWGRPKKSAGGWCLLEMALAGRRRRIRQSVSHLGLYVPSAFLKRSRALLARWAETLMAWGWNALWKVLEGGADR